MLNVRLYFGPSIYAREPVTVADAGAWGAVPLPDVRDALAAALPEIPASRLASLAAGAAAQPQARLRLLAALAAELQNQHSGAIETHGVAAAGAGHVAFFGYHDRIAATLALRAARLAIGFAADGGPDAADGGAQALAGLLAQLEARCKARHPAYYARTAFELARRKGIPARELIPGAAIYQFGHGARSIRYSRAMSDADSAIGVSLVHNKILATALMARLGLPHTRQIAVGARAELVEAARKLGYPPVSSSPPTQARAAA
jgi:hypothetical protein